MNEDLKQLSISDPRIPDEARNDPAVQKAIREGYRYFWDPMDCKLRFIKRSYGKLECVVTENAFANESTTPRQRLVQQFAKFGRGYKSN